MKSIKYEDVVSCPPVKLFRLINSVEHYPKFLSWCKAATIDNRNPITIEASVLIQKYGFSFRCPFAYTLRSKNEIFVSLPSGGPFYSVSATWRFSGDNATTTLSFELKIDHKNTWWVNFFVIPILKNEVKNLVKAFKQRASIGNP